MVLVAVMDDVALVVAVAKMGPVDSVAELALVVALAELVRFTQWLRWAWLLSCMI